MSRASVGRVLFFRLRIKLRRTAVALAEAVGPGVTGGSKKQDPPYRQLWKVVWLFILVSVPVSGLQISGGGKTIWDGVFTDQQATRGQETYKTSCAACHKEDLLGDPGTPALAGPEFLNRFTGSTVDDILQTVRASMPQDAPDSLGTATYVDLISFLLKTNGGPAGAVELPQDREKLKEIRVTSKQ